MEGDSRLDRWLVQPVSELIMAQDWFEELGRFCPVSR